MGHLLIRVKSSLTNLHVNRHALICTYPSVKENHILVRKMERLGSTLVFSLVVAVCLVAFGFYIARTIDYGRDQKCMCFGRPLSPGSDHAWSIILFHLFSASLTNFIPNNHNKRIISFFGKTNYRIFFLMYHYINTMLYIHNYRMSFLVADACLIARAKKKI
ncbi:hypothetical protein HID58_083509 [Brassica napus]|uniref:Uncharacterized protein n=1 Tax=Brassica napus TaxID=3708 RepID=A0ABQ7YDH8_BRANA|nr:hypothetical protein HID58_083509 [Brassica napus]